MNDGSAFPFVVFGLSWLEAGSLDGWVGAWAWWRLAWAVPAGLWLGYAFGRLIGRLGITLRQHTRDLHAPSDFLCLAVIALAYAGAEAIGAWGFLAVFAAGVGVRHAERRSAEPAPGAARSGAGGADGQPPSEHVVPDRPDPQDLANPTVAAGVLVGETLVFGETLERLLEVVLVVLVGILLAPHASPVGMAVAAALFLVIRPAAVGIALARSSLSRRQHWLLGWFGIRGIGSLYYLAYALGHGLDGPDALLACDVVVTVVAASIVVHGVTGQPLVDWYESRLAESTAHAGG